MSKDKVDQKNGVNINMSNVNINIIGNPNKEHLFDTVLNIIKNILPKNNNI